MDAIDKADVIRLEPILNRLSEDVGTQTYSHPMSVDEAKSKAQDEVSIDFSNLEAGMKEHNV